ncbi:C6 zinc finger protein [Corynespora cassiicola Philippines]|uniref:C6 zinc finger protein n=1 Tax=Corynespora cassiicola Philippines TaxID=1448308 RepID=A0A2T2NT48_CORCC|nr:C6 zinc finger protein [Corynespora cassiicola Philippines]
MSPREQARKRFRVSHRKSRAGCTTCKARRVKCGEEKPTCRRCLKRGLDCDYSATVQIPTPNPSIQTHAPTQDAGRSPRAMSMDASVRNETPSAILNIGDLELLHVYHTSTCHSIVWNISLQDVLKIELPQLGFTHHFLLHGILALSALHLTHFRKHKAQHYLAQAVGHYDIALSTAMAELANISDENCEALYGFGMLGCLIAFAWGPKPGDYLLFGERGIGEWLVLARGSNAVFQAKEHILRHGVLAGMFQTPMCLRQQVMLPTKESERLLELRAQFELLHQDDPNLPLYLTALDQLMYFFSVDASKLGSRRQATFQDIVAWLHLLEDDFVDCLNARHPAALAIFACYCVLLNDIPSAWLMRGWVDHLMSGIYDSMDVEYRIWIKWPQQQIGWIPK